MYSYKFPICTVNPVRRSPHESGVIDDWELFYVKSCLRRAKIDFFYPISRLCLFMREIIFLQVAQLNLTLSNVRRSLSSGWQDASQRMIEELQNSLNRQREIVSHYCIVDDA